MYRSNSLCVHRLQVLHCMLVWDCSVEYVQYVWVQFWMVTLVWKRQKQRPCLHAQRSLPLPLVHMIHHVTECDNSATVLLFTLQIQTHYVKWKTETFSCLLTDLKGPLWSFWPLVALLLFVSSWFVSSEIHIPAATFRLFHWSTGGSDATLNWKKKVASY